MKKFFNLFLTAMVMCAAVSMTSCSKDDDPIVKDDVVEVSIFNALISPSYFDYYDIKLAVKNESKERELTLNPTDCKPYQSGTHSLYLLVLDSVDGVPGVSTITATVTPKANIEDLLKALDPDKQIYFAAGVGMTEGKYSASGNYVNAGSGISTSSGDHTPTELLSEVRGQLLYKNMAVMLTAMLTHD